MNLEEEAKSSIWHKLPRSIGLGFLWTAGCYAMQAYLIWSVPEAKFNAPHNVEQRKIVIVFMFIGIALSIYGASRERKNSPAVE